jgi:predicted Zn-dependent protease
MRAAAAILPLLLATLCSACGVFKKHEKAPAAHTVRADGSEVSFTNAYLQAEAQFLSGSGDLGLAAFLALEREHPDNDAVLYRIACIHFKADRSSEALFYMKKARKLNPQNRWYRETEAEILEAQGLYAQAAEIYEQLMREIPNRAALFQEALRLQIRAGNRSKALQLIELREAQVGLRSYSTEEKIRLLKSEGRYPEAVEAMKKLREKYPDRMAYTFREAELCVEAQMFDRAIPLLTDILSQNPANAKAEVLLLSIRLKRGETSNTYEAIVRLAGSTDLEFGGKKQLLDQWRRNVTPTADSMSRVLSALQQAHPDDVRVLEYCGDLASELRMDSLAAACYLRMIQNVSIFQEAAGFRAFEKTIRALQWTADWKNLSETAGDMVSLYPVSAVAHYWLAYAAFQQQKLDEAFESASYGAGIAFELHDRLLLSALLQRILCAQGKLDEALSLANNNLLQWPKEPRAQAQLAYMLALKGNTAEAEKRALEAAANPGADVEAVQLMLGWVLFYGDKPADAIRVWRALHSPETKEPQLLEALGDAYAKTNNRTQAHIYWQQALKAGGDAVKLNKKLYEP